jgi:hypothetical protein
MKAYHPMSTQLILEVVLKTKSHSFTTLKSIWRHSFLSFFVVAAVASGASVWVILKNE